MNDLITPEIINSFHEELEKLSYKRLSTKAIKALHRKRKAKKAAEAAYNSYKMRSPGREAFVGKRKKKPNTKNIASDTPFTQTSDLTKNKKDGWIKTIIRGLRDTAIIGSVAVAGGAVSQPSPSELRYK